MEQSNLIKEINSWVGTPYHHQSSLKKVGCDCFGLIYGVYNNLSLTRYECSINYNESWFNKPELKLGLINELNKISYEVKTNTPGDILVFSVRNMPIHCAFLVENNMMVHCMSDKSIQKVVLSNYSDSWKNRKSKTYRLKIG